MGATVTLICISITFVQRPDNPARTRDTKELDRMIRNLSIKAFGEIYGPARSKTYELINEGVLRRIKIGSRSFITIESAEAFRDSLLADGDGSPPAEQPAAA